MEVLTAAQPRSNVSGQLMAPGLKLEGLKFQGVSISISARARVERCGSRSGRARREDRPRSSAVAAVWPQSSLIENMGLAGSRSSWPSNQARRRFRMSERSCSSACADSHGGVHVKVLSLIVHEHLQVAGSSSEPDCMTRFVSRPDQTHIRSALMAGPGFRLRRCGSGDETIPFCRHFAKVRVGPSPGPAGNDHIPVDSRKVKCCGVLSLLHDCALDDDARSHVFPERHQQLACQCRNRLPFPAPAIVGNAGLVPLRERRVRLMPEPQPRHLAQRRSQARRLSNCRTKHSDARTWRTRCRSL